MALEDARAEVDTALTRAGFLGRSFENSFAGVPSFLRRRYAKRLDGVELAITGAPFDQGVTHRPGARFGPRAIREASALQAPDPPHGWGIDPMTEIAIADHGDVAFDYARPGDFAPAMEAHVAAILAAGAGAITLGGDHSVTLPVLRAHAARHGPLALCQFDAHPDTWAEADSTRIDHGTVFTKAVAEGLVLPEASVQIGIRTENPDKRGFTEFDARAVHEQGPAAIAARARAVLGARPVYLSFDIDCLDPAFAPGTGTPVWGGLSSAQAAILLRDLAGLRVVGGDVVEVCPPHDPAGITAIAGAHAATALICLWARGRQ